MMHVWYNIPIPNRYACTPDVSSYLFPARGPVPAIKLHVSLHVYVNHLAIFYSLISLLDPTKPIHTPKLLALCLARARFLDKLILLAVICTYAGTLYTIHADVHKHPMIFCLLRIIWISSTTTVDSALILTQIADCFITQITSDLPKSSVNTIQSTSKNKW